MGRILDLSTFRTPGTILVLNQSKFDGKYAEPREGTEIDVNSLKRVFRDELKFTWEQADDLTVDQIHEKIKEYANKDYSDVGALVIVILTHGRESGVLCAKDDTYKFIHIYGPIRQSETLHNKLKWFIVQACRSGDSDKHEKRVKLPITAPRNPRMSVYLPPRVNEKVAIHQALSGTINTVISFSTVEGRVSTRSKETGSIMIQTLCNQLETSALERESLLSILCHVNRTVSSHRLFEEDENETFAQTSSFMSSLLHDVLFPKLSRDQFVTCGSVPTTSSSQLAKPKESEEYKTPTEQSNETLDIKKDGKLVKKVSYSKVQPYPLDEKYKYAGRAYIFHDDDCQKNLVERIETVTRDTLKLTPIEKRVRGTSDAIQELIQVANTDNFGQEACFFAFVLVDFNWQEFNNGVINLKRAFFSTACETLASKPKIFIFVDAGRAKWLAAGPEPQSDYIEELGYANQHSDMLFVNNFKPTYFLPALLKTLSSPGDRDFITLITDAIGDSSEHLQYPEYNKIWYLVPKERTSPNDLYENFFQEGRVKTTVFSTIIDCTLRLPFFCIGNFEHCISKAEIDTTNCVGLEFELADPTPQFVGRLEELKQLAKHLSLDVSLVMERSGTLSQPLPVSGTMSIPFPISDPVPFTTADEEQNSSRLTETVEEQESNVVSSDITIDVAITGVQGIGKSQIVLRFIQIYSKVFKNLILIDTENIEVSFNTLMLHSRTETIPAFYNCYKDKGKSLFVFENFNENIENISDYLPPSNISNFSIIVVSRNVSFPNAKYRLKVSSMCHIDAENFVRKLHSTIAPEDLEELVRKFGKHPLALEIVCNCYKYCVELNNLYPSETTLSFAEIIQELSDGDDLPTTPITISKYNGEFNTENIKWESIKDIVNRLPYIE